MNDKALLPASMTLVLVCGLLYSWSLYVVPLEKEFGWNRSQTSLNFSICVLFFTIGMFLAGLLVDLIGRRRTIWCGGLLASLGFLLASFASSLCWLYSSYGVLGGLGIGLMYVVPLATCSSSFPDRSGTVAGIVTMCFGLGNLVLGFFVVSWLVKSLGWAPTFRIVAAMFLLVSLTCGFFVRPRIAIIGRSNVGPENDSWGFTMKEMISSSSFWVYTVWIVSCQSAGLMVIAHIVPFAVESGIPPSLAALAMGIEATANALGRPVAGYATDRYGRRAAMTMTPALMTCGLLLLWGLTQAIGFPGLVIGCVLVAISYGSIYAQNVALILTFFGPRHYTANLGLQGFSMFFGALIGPQIAGMIKAETGSYTISFFAAAAIVVIGLVFGLFVKKPAMPPRAVKNRPR